MEPKAPLADCDNCPLREEPFVPGSGPDQADIVVVGEGPGAEEVKQGIPFVGRSGQLTNKVLKFHGIERENVYVTNAVLCRPPSNETPTAKAVKACRARLVEEVRGRQPKTILALGAVGAKSLLATTTGITDLRKDPDQSSSEFPGSRILCTFHPAAALRSPDKFPTIVTDVGKINRVSIGWEPTKFVVPETDHRAMDLLMKQFRMPQLSLDIEVVHNDKGPTDRHNPEWLCVGISHRPGAAVVYPRHIVESPEFRMQLDLAFRERPIKWVMQFGKFDVQRVWEFAPEARVDEDTALIHYSTDERTGGYHDLETLGVEVLGAPYWKKDAKKYLPKKNSPLSLLPPYILHWYNAQDTDIAHRLVEPLTKSMRDDGTEKVYRELLIPGSDVLAHVEYRGVAIDEEYLERLAVEFEVSLAGKEIELQKWVANPRSPKQIKEVFEDLGIELESTDKQALGEVINRRKDGRDFAEGILDYRGEHKLLTTYVRGLLKRAIRGRIYSSFLLHGSETGRLSSRDPNLQNIPIGSKIRDAFIATNDDYVLVEVDYKGIELRLLADFIKDPYMLEAFLDGRDFHKERAKRLFGADYSKRLYVTTKSIAYGSVYGETAPHLAARLSGTVAEAKKIQADIFDKSPGIKKIYWKEVERKINQQSHLTSFFGRKRRFWLVTRENYKDVLKEGYNFDPQSTASDLNLRALIRIHAARLPGVCPIITVHDALVFEIHKSVLHESIRAIKEIMEDNPEFSVPTPVEVKIGERWGSLREYAADTASTSSSRLRD